MHAPPEHPSKRLDAESAAELDALHARSLGRSLRMLPGPGPTVEVDGRPLINLASNDYLGLAIHPRLIAAAREATARHGTGAGASRLVVGHFEAHERVEQAFARFKHPGSDDAALLLPTGFLANLAVLTTLAGPGDLICLDKLCHASLIDAAQASGAAVRTYPHLGTEKLDRLLARHAQRAPVGVAAHRPPRRFIVTDSVFSMDGDVADLPALCDLAERHDAILLVDEAHGTGVLGETGAGLAELQGVVDRVPVTVSTASKALGGLGGIVTASRTVIDLIVNRARPFIYTTGVPAAQAAALGAALEVVRDEPWRRERVLRWSQRLREGLAEQGWRLPPSRVATPIVPLVTGDAPAALALASRLREAGLLAVAIRPPTVPPGAARVRVSLRADLDEGVIEQLLRAAGTPPA